MAEIQEEIQYHIEIQENELGNQLDGDVMVVLDLEEGQELPDYVAQTIVELARNAQTAGQNQVLSVVSSNKAKAADSMVVNVPGEIEMHPTIPVASEGQVEAAAPKTVTILNPKGFSETIYVDGAHFNRIETSQLKEVENNLVICQGDNNMSNMYITNSEVDGEIRFEHSDHNSLSAPKVNGKEVYNLPRMETSIKEEPILYEIQDSSKYMEVDKNTGEFKDSNELVDSKDGLIIKPELILDFEMKNDASESKMSEKMIEFPCQDCSFVSKSEVDLGRHASSVHKILKSFKCFQCGKAFEKELSFHIHTLTHSTMTFNTKKGFISCPLCQFQCRRKQVLMSHAKESHPTQPVFACALCRYACLCEIEFNDHNLSYRHKLNDAKHTVCPVCSVGCRDVEAHMALMHSNDRPYLCNTCGHRSKTDAALRVHMLTHIDNKDFVCKTCGNAFKSEARLKRHTALHDPVKKYQCSKCSFSTNEGYDYRRHMDKVHSKRASHTCKDCNQKFFKTADLRMHAMAVHNRRDVFYCDYCDFSCIPRTEFREHMQMHSRVHRFSCEKCEFKTPWKCHFDRHLMVHSDVKPFACTKCQYRCKDKMNLKKHMVIHSSEKPHECELCGYRCKLKGMLRSHMRVVHTEVRPYSCSHCSYTAKTAGNLKKHMWIHAEYKPYKCPHCPYKCREGSKLRRHASKRHKAFLKDEDLEIKPDMEEVQVENPIRILKVDINDLPKGVLLDLGDQNKITPKTSQYQIEIQNI